MSMRKQRALQAMVRRVLARAWRQGAGRAAAPEVGRFERLEPRTLLSVSLAAPNLDAGTDGAYQFHILYSDPAGIDELAFAAYPPGVQVTCAGRGYSQPATQVAALPVGTDSLDVTYQITAPDGVWDLLDHGTYAVELSGLGEVVTDAGDPIDPTPTGAWTFAVDVQDRIHVADGTAELGGAWAIGSTTTVRKTGAGLLRVTAAQAHAAGATLQVEAGAVDFYTDAGGAAGARSLNLHLLNSGTAVAFSASQHFQSLSLGAGTQATMTGGGGGRVLVTEALTIANTGGMYTALLDLTDHGLAVDYPAGGSSPLPEIGLMLRAGVGPDLIWNGTGGLTSSAARYQSATYCLGMLGSADTDPATLNG